MCWIYSGDSRCNLTKDRKYRFSNKIKKREKNNSNAN